MKKIFNLKIGSILANTMVKICVVKPHCGDSIVIKSSVAMKMAVILNLVLIVSETTKLMVLNIKEPTIP